MPRRPSGQLVSETLCRVRLVLFVLKIFTADLSVDQAGVVPQNFINSADTPVHSPKHSRPRLERSSSGGSIIRVRDLTLLVPQVPEGYVPPPSPELHRVNQVDLIEQLRSMMDGMLVEKLSAQKTEIVSSLQGSVDEVRAGIEEERAERAAVQEKLEERIVALESPKGSALHLRVVEWWLKSSQKEHVCVIGFTDKEPRLKPPAIDLVTTALKYVLSVNYVMEERVGTIPIVVLGSSSRVML